MEETKQWGLGIDCAPGMLRPDVYADYIKDNIYDGVEYTITSKWFGHWEFAFKEGWYLLKNNVRKVGNTLRNCTMKVK